MLARLRHHLAVWLTRRFYALQIGDVETVDDECPHPAADLCGCPLDTYADGRYIERRQR
jgi:hypothetical protein